ATSFVSSDDEELLDARASFRELLKKYQAERSVEHDEVVKLGGLFILGSERHESRRIDNQLRGRSGRQGDPGTTQFFISLEDELMRLFGGDRVQGMVSKLGLREGEAIEAGMLSKSIENAQKQVEGRNYGIRKYVLQYDDVMNRQRSVIYSQRKRVLMGEDLTDTLDGMMKDIAGEIADYIAAGSEFPEEWDFDEMNKRIKAVNRAIPAIRPTDEEKLSLTRDKLEDLIYKDFIISYAKKEEEIGEERLRELERMILLWVVDRMWMDHIDAMDQLKAGIGLRSIGQQDPAQAYANEGGDMFEMMIRNIGDEMVKYCFAITVQTDSARKEVVSIGQSKKDEVVSAAESERRKAASADTVRPGQQIRGSENRGGEKPQPIRVAKTPGRNDPCPCGSGKKYKNCHGRNR
ncbi:MAG: SEC-C domain-containing protein, partial [Firmicutes bacterium]|nr:SEC-C domain-containing protein [Bacillota bacterium]